MPSEFDTVLAAILQAEEQSGTKVDLQEWIERYPHHAERLREFQRLRSDLNALGRQQSDPTVAYPLEAPVPLATVRYFGGYLLEEVLGQGAWGLSIAPDNHDSIGWWRSR